MENKLNYTGFNTLIIKLPKNFKLKTKYKNNKNHTPCLFAKFFIDKQLFLDICIFQNKSLFFEQLYSNTIILGRGKLWAFRGKILSAEGDVLQAPETKHPFRIEIEQLPIPAEAYMPLPTPIRFEKKSNRMYIQKNVKIKLIRIFKYE